MLRVVLRRPNGTWWVPPWALRVDEVSRATIGTWLSPAVQVVGEELWVRGVPRGSSGVSEAEAATGTWVIDAVPQGPGWTGQTAKALWVSGQSPVAWEVLVLPDPDSLRLPQ